MRRHCRKRGEAKGLRREHIKQIMAAKAATPEAANNLIKILRVMLNYAVELDMIESNPATDIKRYKSRGDGIPSRCALWITSKDFCRGLTTRHGGIRSASSIGTIVRSSAVVVGQRFERGVPRWGQARQCTCAEGQRTGRSIDRSESCHGWLLMR